MSKGVFAKIKILGGYGTFIYCIRTILTKLNNKFNSIYAKGYVGVDYILAAKEANLSLGDYCEKLWGDGGGGAN